MDTSRHSESFRRTAVSLGGPPADGDGRLIPVLRRAIETGRGSPELMRWLAGRLPAGVGPPATIGKLAGELNRVVRRAGVAETVVG